MTLISIMFVVVGIQGVFLALILSQRRNISSLLLGILILLIGMDGLSHVAYLKPYLFLLNHGNLFLLGPLFYVFVLSINRGSRLKLFHFLHLAPFVAIKLFSIIVEVRDIQISVQSAKLASYFMALYALSYSILSLYVLTRKQMAIGKTDSKYVLKLNIIFLLGWFLSIGARVLEGLGHEAGPILWQITYLTAGVFIYYITWELIKNTKLLSEQTYSYKQIAGFEQKLRHLLEEKKLYMDPSLRRQDIAQLLGVSNHELSYQISRQLQISFTDFVNGYRVEEFKKRIEADPNPRLTFLAIALECGFGSKASFQRVFKKSTGITPSEFKMRIQKIN